MHTGCLTHICASMHTTQGLSHTHTQSPWQSAQLPVRVAGWQEQGAGHQGTGGVSPTPWLGSLGWGCCELAWSLRGGTEGGRLPARTARPKQGWGGVPGLQCKRPAPQLPSRTPSTHAAPRAPAARCLAPARAVSNTPHPQHSSNRERHMERATRTRKFIRKPSAEQGALSPQPQPDGEGAGEAVEPRGSSPGAGLRFLKLSSNLRGPGPGPPCSPTPKSQRRLQAACRCPEPDQHPRPRAGSSWGHFSLRAEVKAVQTLPLPRGPGLYSSHPSQAAVSHVK